MFYYYPIILKFATAVICAKYQNVWTTETDVMHKLVLMRLWVNLWYCEKPLDLSQGGILWLSDIQDHHVGIYSVKFMMLTL